MTSVTEVRLAEVLGALSHALDMTEGQPAGHCVRCCYIGMAIGEELRLTADQTHDLYYTLLLKDLGCSSNAARICELYVTDDIVFKRDFKQLDESLPKVLKFVLSHAGLKAGLAERFRTILNIARNGGEIARELIETRCQRGAEIARQMRFSESVARGILDLDEHWDGGGKPMGLKGTAIALKARIALLAQVVDVFFTGSGGTAALTEVRQRAGTWFDPELVAVFERVAANPDFFASLGAPDLEQRVLSLAPAHATQLVDDDLLDDIAAAFALVIDAKSPYTSGHSNRVALFTDMIAEEIAMDPARRRWLRRAALLHDIGKLGVSNAILDKPARLEGDEWTAMQNHAALSEMILSRINAFAELASIAGAHHERLDGKGYPRGITAEFIAPETRMISVADVFDALTADRPYRAAMPVSKAFEIMEKDAGHALDPVYIAALKAALARVGFRKAA